MDPEQIWNALNTALAEELPVPLPVLDALAELLGVDADSFELVEL